MALSYSGWGTHHKCAAKYKYAYIDKLPQPTSPGPAAERGTRIHKSVEEYIAGTAPKMDKEIHAKHGKFIHAISNTWDCTPELKWAFDKEWLPVDFKDKTARVRGVIDLVGAKPKDAAAWEWKTGKVYEDHLYQNHLYGLVMLATNPHIKRTTVTNYYFDQPTPAAPHTYEQKELSLMKITWQERLDRVEQDTVYVPNPSYLCRYCAFSKAAGGPCRF